MVLMCVGMSLLLTGCVVISFAESLQVLGHLVNLSLEAFQSTLGLWAYSQSVPRMMLQLPMVVIYNSVSLLVGTRRKFH